MDLVVSKEEQNILDNAGLRLELRAEGLFLCGENVELQGNFEEFYTRVKSPAKLFNEQIVKAVHAKSGTHPIVFDATAGMGEDSFLLAAAGCRVVLFEKNPIIARLLEDAVSRAKQAKLIDLREIASRMSVVNGDSVLLMEEQCNKIGTPDVVYLDPMFPERQKSGLIKKKFQLLQQLEAPCEENDGKLLFEAALKTGAGKIVVKRPLKAPFLVDRKPDNSIVGSTIRYDCYVKVKD